MDAVAQALADPIRREILVMLHESPRTAGAIADAFTVSRPAVSRHLRVLREAGLVRDTVNGREREYQLAVDALETEVHRVRRGREAQEREQTTQDKARTNTTTHSTKRRSA